MWWLVGCWPGQLCSLPLIFQQAGTSLFTWFFSGFQVHQEGMPQCTEVFKHLFYIMFDNVSLAKASHIANPDSMGGETVPISWWKICKVTLWDARRRLSGYFYNLLQNGSQLFCWVFSNVRFCKFFSLKKILLRRNFQGNIRLTAAFPVGGWDERILPVTVIFFLNLPVFILMSHIHLCFFSLNW